MALLSRKRFGNEDLGEKWECIGSGGFGNVYKTKWKFLGVDVAIKLSSQCAGFRLPVEESLYKEADFMDNASFKFVVRVCGLYEGCPPFRETVMQKGIVMEFMERGCVRTLLETLSGPPHWPLAFRLAHEVALGMNFLHSKHLVHQDLKPSNVLLDDDLHAKLSDFGLSRVSNSALSTQENQEIVGGTDKYMPPEAFEESYQPVRSFDVYSYGILLWSILSGKEPYPAVKTSARLKFRVKKGDRPTTKELEKKEVNGFKELIKLMKECWDGDSSSRPPFVEIIETTNKVFLTEKTRVRMAVNEVLKILDKDISSQCSQSSGAAVFTPETQEQLKTGDTVDHRKFTPQQTPVKALTENEKAKFVDKHMPTIVQDTLSVMAIAKELQRKNMIHKEIYSEIVSEKKDEDKMRVIDRKALYPGGCEVKAAFYDALKTNEPEMMKKLEG